MVGWWKTQWGKFAASYDAPAAAVQSNPTAILLGVGSLVAGFLVIGYVPVLAEASELRMPWLPAGFAVAGALCSYTAWRNRATGTLGTACMLLDTALYTTSLSLGAVLSTSPFSLGFAIALALFLLAFPARVYSLTLLIAVAMSGPPLLITLWMEQDALVGVVVWAACSVALTSTYRTGQQRALREQNERLRSALGAADQVAEQSMETALAASLLDIGHFLHELRNLRAVQQTNLQYVREEGGLEGDAREALEEAITAQNSENKLITDAIERLRRKANPARESFALHDVLTEFARSRPGSVRLELDLQGPLFFIRGDREHVKAVLNNLVRNAERAGATHVWLGLRPNANSKSALLAVEDDGPGLRQDQVKDLFKPFAGHAEGMGLGLYLTSRYVRLLGGSIEASNRAEGGAVFRVVLPGNLAGDAG
jgi:signal transduction histidine kinase